MSGPSEEAPLSELCTICHINVPKYRCPRCFTRTCSLVCSQRHKKWSQCSGVRDPAAYLRRSELATPAAFDRDFNFITGIERSLERAERDAENRGISLEHDYICSLDGKGASKKRKRPPEMVKGEAGFLRGAEAAGVKLERAPRGMTRNKQNASRWHQKHKCLTWTVEWVTPSGQRTLRNCLETCTLAEAYDRVYPVPKEEKEKQSNPSRLQDKEPGLREETNGDLSSSGSHEQQLAPTTDTSLAGSQYNEGLREAEMDPSREEQGPDAAAKIDGDESQAPPASEVQDSQTQQTQTQPLDDSLPSSSTSISAPAEPLPHRNLYFYLHRPRTATRQTVLIPVSPTAPLKTILRNRTIVEFPTIYLLESSPKELSTKEDGEFLLEELYLQSLGETGEETEDDTSSSSSSDSSDTLGDDDEDEDENEEESDLLANQAGTASVPNLNNIDEKKVLEVLKQDLYQAGSTTTTA
ncbi:hypothetical protein VTN77DRAFT_8215 [Rasamsonia byssochlamydoides]|uniref:uncharacterized protein n=1 Tax=Rasamsonia byssochlamydoides TaxID=89139 RepID=UPI00374425E0